MSLGIAILWNQAGEFRYSYLSLPLLLVASEVVLL